MEDFVQFLTSREIMVVYLLSGIVCFISLMIYIFRKRSEIVRLKNNTKELNKLVEQVRERVPEVEETVSYDVPVIERVEDVLSVSEMLQESFPKEEVELLEEDTPETPEIIYTTIEPNPEEARLELERVTKELEEQESQQVFSLTEFEDEQEKNAIISMVELLQKLVSMYQSNEETQYQEEEALPISIQDLEEKVGKKVTPIEEMPKVETPVKPVVVSNNSSRFKSSPIISPIFGIEREVTHNDLALENTANYEKLDEQIKKSSEFVMSMKEFQKNNE